MQFLIIELFFFHDKPEQDQIDECNTDWKWTIWEKGEKREDGYFTLSIYQVGDR